MWSFSLLNKLVLLSFCFCLVVMVALNWMFDPLHLLSAPNKVDVYDRQARFGHAGIVRYTETGDVFIGSSVFQDLSEDVYNSLTGRQMTRLPVPGASPVELFEVTDTLLKFHHETIGRVVLGMDFFVWGKNSEDAKWQHFPQHLYNDIPFVPVRYVGSFQTFSRLVRLFPDYYLLDGRERTYQTRYRATYKHGLGKSEVFKHACKILDKKKAQVNSLTVLNARRNIESYLKPLIKSYPKVEFVLMLPGYSLLEYAQYQEFGKLSDFLKFREILGVWSLGQKQVQLMDAQTDKTLMLDLDLFYDATHGGQDVLDSFFDAPVISSSQEIFSNSGDLVRLSRQEGHELYQEMLRDCSLKIKI